MLSEQQISEAVLKTLSSNGTGKATYAELRIELKKTLTFNSSDLDLSGTRPGETMWEQRLRNITSHKKSEGNYIYLGYLSEIDSGLEITPAGLAHINQK